MAPAQVFCFETDALRWLAENAEGPDENARAELLQLAHAREDLATYRIESHDLQLQPNLF
jgi:hypothetical protein